MNYWLFIIMYDWYPESWKAMVEAGIAAEHYPPGWDNETRNINALKKLKRGDVIVAAFKRHRFAGYGTLTSDFYRGGPPLEIYDPQDEEYLEFAERFNCDWTVIPFENSVPFIHCKDLKKQGFDIDLIHGLCVKQIDENTFRELELRLNEASAKRFFSSLLSERATAPDIPVPPPRIAVMTTRPVRDTVAAKQLKMKYEYRCQVCGERIEISRDEFYAEVHHIRPLGGEDQGIDEIENMLVLCPNHHVMFDLGIPRFLSMKEIEINQRRFQLIFKHGLSKYSVEYHNERICKAR